MWVGGVVYSLYNEVYDGKMALDGSSYRFECHRITSLSYGLGI